jgi:sec-independent protein translocase protein TatA
MPNIGPTELIIVLVIVLVIFGPKRLPGLGRQLGSGLRDFKEAVSSKHGGDDDEDGSVAGLPAPPPTEVVDEPVVRPVAAERPREDA